MTATSDQPEDDASSKAPPGNARVPRDERFRQLLDKARGDDMCAVADLFQEFGFRFGEEEAQ